MRFYRETLSRFFFVALLGVSLASCSGSNDASPSGSGSRGPGIVSVSQSTDRARLGEVVVLEIEASDSDGRPLAFRWTASDGGLESLPSTATTSRARWSAPVFDGDCLVTVQITDGNDTTVHNFTFSALAANTRDHVEAYLVQRPRNVTGLLQTYDPLAGHPGIEFRHDVYDNSLAAIFLTAQGNQAGARGILDAFVALSGSGSQLLSAAYNPDGTVADWRQDTGNNSYAILALMQYVQQFGDVNGYDGTARALMSTMSVRLCGGALGGYRGEDAVNWRSIEHNVDIFAAARLLGDSKAMNSAASFVASMWVPGGNEDFYTIGTTDESMCTDNRAFWAIPTDAQTWTMLALADDVPDRKRGSLNWAVDHMYRTDTDENGDVFAGFVFSNAGSGIHLENTASGAMALATYLARFGASDPNRTALTDAAVGCRTTLFRQLDTHGYVPATVLPQASTGLGWDYFRTAHLAATVWTGFLAGYHPADDGSVNELYNPYTPAP